MTAHTPRLPFKLDPLIAEAKRRMRRRRVLVLVLTVTLAGAAAGMALTLRGPSAPRYNVGPSITPAARSPVQHIGSGPFVLNGGFAGGGESGLYGDGGDGPKGTSLGCIKHRHYSQAFGIQNRSHAPVTLVGADGANPSPRIIDLVAIQLRLSPPLKRPSTIPNYGPDMGGMDLVYKHWSAAPTRAVTLPPGRIATVQSNYLMHDCAALASGRKIVVPGSLVLHYRVSGRIHQKMIPLPSQRFVVLAGPTKRRCTQVAGSVSVVTADTGCSAGRQAAVACHPMSHNSWGDCTVAGVLWDCGSTAGPGSPYLETCWQPTKKAHWFRVRWNPPTLSSGTVGGVQFGLPRKEVVTRLSELLGTRSTNPPLNRACGPGYTEVGWQHLYVELRHGRLTGFRYIEDGWPPTSVGKHAGANDRPPMLTTRGITLGSTLAQARTAYGHLRPVGTNRWQTPDGLILYDDAHRYPDPPSSRITEIKYGTCGDF
jgi:hypothetical protein